MDMDIFEVQSLITRVKTNNCNKPRSQQRVLHRLIQRKHRILLHAELAENHLPIKVTEI